ncbi:FGGY family carbohydrate kinase [Paracoccus albus]|uniref:FGGY family carbohydrate kinase n=1 Tax=Paracoccus albus TaxID=3017784 RepID=UPI0022F1167C|nr:FGGY family carbohydrate kinase [Paracoccus albus]WBU62027.1 FGGY family carbohydrate kinase [Paracoccus albus]
MNILAIDQGTTSTRALLHDGEVLRPVCQKAHRQIMPAKGHVEHDPDELLANLDEALKTDADLVGLANQGESCLAWDARDGRPVSPVIVWQDDRTAAETAHLQADGLGPEVMSRAGLPLDPYFSASKLGWILRNCSEAAELARQGRLRMGTTDAFFRDRLTGRFQTDIATASRTSLMNIETGQWDEELCRMFGVNRACLPEITDTAGDLGVLPNGARLVVSIVDQQAALYGHDCRVPGAAKITFGTGAFVQCVTDRLVKPAQPGPLPTIAWRLPGQGVRYALDGAVYTAAAAIDWARSLNLFRDYDEIGSFAKPAAIDRQLVFLPALAGLACPHWDRKARGSWFGMSLEHGAHDLMQALLEGVAMRTAEVVQAIAAEQAITSLSVDGGMAQNDYLLSFLAGLLPQPVSRARETESTALGLVHMALDAEGTDRPAPISHQPVRPVEADRRLADGRMAKFALIRERLSSLSHELAALK